RPPYLSGTWLSRRWGRPGSVERQEGRKRKGASPPVRVEGQASPEGLRPSASCPPDAPTKGMIHPFRPEGTFMLSAEQSGGHSAAPPEVVETTPGSLSAGRLQFLSRLVGSLQLAVILLTCFAAALVLGTLVESRYAVKVAHQLVYETWWFVLLIGL